MRMHRGSSKGDGPARSPPETLPLSASPEIRVEVEIARAGTVVARVETVRPGTTVRELLRAIGRAPEGSAVLRDGRSIPLDTRIEEPLHLVVVPTFSGG